MAMDLTAPVIAEIAFIEGLSRRIRRREQFSGEFVRGYREATQERITEQFWFSADSANLGKILLHDGFENFLRFAEDLAQIAQKLEDACARKELPEGEKSTVLRECQQFTVAALEKIQALNGGTMPFNELAWYLSSLKETSNNTVVRN